MEVLGIIAAIAIILFNIIGIIWLGISWEHPFLVTIAYIVLLIVVGNINGDVCLVIALVVAVISLIACIYAFVCWCKDFVCWCEEEKEIKEKKQRNVDLLEAVKNGDVESAKMLIEKGGDIEYCDSEKQEPMLQIAVKKSDKEMVSLLLDNGADENCVCNGKTPLDFATNEEIITLLKSKGAKTKAELEAEAEEYYIQACNFCNDGLNFKMIEYLEKAANLGHILAHHNLAICYMAGTYVEKDIDKAIELLTVPAEAGNVDSQLNLGVALFHKYPTNNLMDSIEQVKASDWFKKAAEQGSVEAMYNLGLFYLSLEDFDDAGTWFEKAARQGNEEALKALKNLCSRGLYFVKM